MKNRFIRFAFVVFLSSLTTFLSASVSDGGQGTDTKKMNSQEYLAKIKNNQLTGSTSIADVVSAKLATQAMMSHKSSMSSFSWSSLGPNNMAGPSKAVIFDNRDESGKTLYAGSNNGGLWKSTNTGATWEKVETDEVLNVSSITQAPNGTIYVATGISLEPASESLSEGSTIGKGIWKSNGDSFELMEGTAPTDADISADWAFIQKVAVDDNNHIYAATNGGLMYYNGSSWSVATASDTLDLVGKSCDVVIEGGTIIAAVAGKTYISNGASNGFVLKSGDEDDMLPMGSFGNIKFAISKSNTDYIYASYVKTNGSLHNVYVSIDNGDTWRIVYPGGSSLEDIFNGQGLRNNAITVNPQFESSVILGAYNLYYGYEAQPTGYYNWQQISNGSSNPYPIMGSSNYVHYGINSIVFNPNDPAVAIITSDGGLSITKTYGNTYEILNRNLNTSEFYTINASKSGDVVAGAQFNGLQAIVNNGSNSAFELFNLNTTGGPSPLTGAYSHVSFINPEFIVGSASDGTFWRSEDEAANKNFDILEGVEIGEEFMSPFKMWESNKMEFLYDTVEYKAYKDYEAGETIWVNSNSYDFPFQVTLEEDLDSLETRLFMDPVGSRSFIAVQGDSEDLEGGVYMTTGMLDFTAAPTWWQIGAIDGLPSSLDFSNDINYVWVGTVEGRLYRMSNTARATNEEKADINSPGCIVNLTEITLPTTQSITSISVDKDDPDNILVTLGNYGNTDYVLLCTNGTSDNPTFTSIQANLPAMPVYSSALLINGKSAFVGTENGLFYASNVIDGTPNWDYESAPFGDVPVFALMQQTNNWPSIGYQIGSTYYSYPGATNFGSVYVGTFGNGAYITNDFVGFDEFEDQLVKDMSLNIYPNPASNQVSISFNVDTYDTYIVEIFDLSGKRVSILSEEVQSGNNIIEIDTYHIDNGSYIIRVSNGTEVYQNKLVISK